MISGSSASPKSFHAYTEIDFHPRVNKFQCKTPTLILQQNRNTTLNIKRQAVQSHAIPTDTPKFTTELHCTPKTRETYQNYFKRPKTVCPTLKKWLFFIVFHVLERTEHGIIHGWRRRLNSHKLPSGEQIIIQVVGISHLARPILLFSYQFIEVS